MLYVYGNVPRPAITSAWGQGMARLRKFNQLAETLQAVPQEQDSIRLTFAQLEAMADGPLPRGAWTSSYWSNSTVSRKNWRPLGFSARLERHAQAVVFARQRRSAIGHAAAD